MVEQIQQRQPGQWVQLVGNQEGQYLPGGKPFWPDRLARASVELLTGWWETGAMNVAAAVATDGDEYLITHAGLTVGSWQDIDEPMTVSSAAWLLNDRPAAVIWRGGEIAVARDAGPLWAEAGWELYEPWLEHHAAGGLVPFGQIYGHSAVVRYADQTWRTPGRVRQRASVDWATRQVRVRIGGRVFIGIDPKHGRHGAPAWQPLILNDTTILSPTATGPRS